MSHSHHGHHHDMGGPDASGNRIRTAFFLNLGFTIIEIIGGYLTNSVAIYSDALHDLGDSLSLGLAWGLQRYSGKQGDEVFSYGYQRFSLLGALLNTVILILGSIFVLSEAVPRLMNPEHADARGMLGLAVLGIAVNGLAVWRMRGGGSLNERVVSWHLMEDVLGWVAVFIVAVIMLIRDIPILDPILSILVTLYILWNVLGSMKKTMAIFLQGVPEDMTLKDVETEITDLPEVSSVHDTHLWSLDGERHVLTTHVVSGSDLSQAQSFALRERIKDMLRSHGIQHATIEVEAKDEGCDVDEEKPDDQEPESGEDRKALQHTTRNP